MDIRTMQEVISTSLTEAVHVRPYGGEEYLVSLPFRDSSGDPIELAVSVANSWATIDDGGAIAGLLFSLGQHTANTPAFKLVRDLERAHGLQIDYDEGLVRLSVPEERLYEGVADLAKVVVALHTVVPHIRVTPRRMRSVAGPRLKSRIRGEYRAMNILHLVEPDHEIDGVTVHGWAVDFHWAVQTNSHAREVDVVAADLSVSEPLDRAQRIAALSMDTQGLHQNGDLRVIIDLRADDQRAAQARDFLRHYKDRFHYDLVDFGLAEERSRFLQQAEDELTGPAGAAWREVRLTR